MAGRCETPGGSRITRPTLRYPPMTARRNQFKENEAKFQRKINTMAAGIFTLSQSNYTDLKKQKTKSTLRLWRAERSHNGCVMESGRIHPVRVFAFVSHSRERHYHAEGSTKDSFVLGVFIWTSGVCRGEGGRDGRLPR